MVNLTISRSIKYYKNVNESKIKKIVKSFVAIIMGVKPKL